MKTQVKATVSIVTAAAIALSTQAIAVAKVQVAERYRATQIDAEDVVLGPVSSEAAVSFEARPTVQPAGIMLQERRSIKSLRVPKIHQQERRLIKSLRVPKIHQQERRLLKMLRNPQIFREGKSVW